MQPLSNGAEVAGKIVMVNRGLCGFEVKARNVERGRHGVVIANRDPEVFAMSGDEDPDPSISTVMIGRDDWQPIFDTVDTETVNVTIKDASGPGPTPTAGSWVRTRSPSAERSATCGRRPVTVTPAR